MIAQHRRSPLFALAASAALLAAPTGAAAHGVQVADIVDQVGPAVVDIVTEQARRPAAQSPFAQDGPFREFFERFGRQFEGGRGGSAPRQSQGSGFILDAQGYVVTNNHVIDGADTITLRLADEREFEARLIGGDELTDIALLKIDAPSPLPSVRFGDSDRIRVGEEVMAVGNAFGLGGSVTTGIVSAKDRRIPIGGPYVDYIQTDTAINRGNSGGPLFNMRGEVIGVNSSIFSPSGGSVGVGFAVPSNLVARIVADLRDDGAVGRGWLGVTIQPVTDALADALGLGAARGAMVAGVDPSGPSAGVLRSGDLILDFDNRPVRESADLPRLVAATAIGRAAPVRLRRDGVEQTVYVTLGALDRAMSAPRPASTAPFARQSDRIGAELAAASSGVGARVVSVEPDGAAWRGGMRRGDVIRRVGEREIFGPADVAPALAAIGGGSALVLVERDGRDLYLGVEIPVG